MRGEWIDLLYYADSINFMASFLACSENIFLISDGQKFLISN